MVATLRGTFFQAYLVVCTSVALCRRTKVAVTAKLVRTASERRAGRNPSSSSAAPSVGPNHPAPFAEADLYSSAAAFAAVARDNSARLVDILRRVDMHTWARWTNDGGSNLQEYAVACKAVNCELLIALAASLEDNGVAYSVVEGENVWNTPLGLQVISFAEQENSLLEELAELWFSGQFAKMNQTRQAISRAVAIRGDVPCPARRVQDVLRALSSDRECVDLNAPNANDAVDCESYYMKSVGGVRYKCVHDISRPAHLGFCIRGPRCLAPREGIDALRALRAQVRGQ